MILLRTTLAAAMVAISLGAAQIATAPPAEAQGFSLRLGGPNFGFSIDRRDRDHDRHWRHRGHHNHGWRYGNWQGRRCAVWSRRCADDDYRDYRRCMRRHDCR